MPLRHSILRFLLVSIYCSLWCCGWYVSYCFKAPVWFVLLLFIVHHGYIDVITEESRYGLKNKAKLGSEGNGGYTPEYMASMLYSFYQFSLQYSLIVAHLSIDGNSAKLFNMVYVSMLTMQPLSFLSETLYHRTSFGTTVTSSMADFIYLSIHGCCLVVYTWLLVLFVGKSTLNIIVVTFLFRQNLPK